MSSDGDLVVTFAGRQFILSLTGRYAINHQPVVRMCALHEETDSRLLSVCITDYVFEESETALRSDVDPTLVEVLIASGALINTKKYVKVSNRNFPIFRIRDHIEQACRKQ